MADFNPRSREGSDHQILDLVLDINISIHAPARGATLIGTIGKSLRLISIHAPARGATPLACYVRFSNRNFNPRSREGSDSFGLLRPLFQSEFQSTLPRGERRRRRLYDTRIRYFNPRSREGSDSKIAHIRNIFSGNYVNLVKICK